MDLCYYMCLRCPGFKACVCSVSVALQNSPGTHTHMHGDDANGQARMPLFASDQKNTPAGFVIVPQFLQLQVILFLPLDGLSNTAIRKYATDS